MIQASDLGGSESGLDGRRCRGHLKRPSLGSGDTLEIEDMALRRMDNVGIVVEDLEGTIDFFRELNLELEGRATIEGEWVGRVTGLADQRVEIAMMRTPDGHSRLELSRFLTPPVVADHRDLRSLGYLHHVRCRRHRRDA